MSLHCNIVLLLFFNERGALTGNKDVIHPHHKNGRKNDPFEDVEIGRHYLQNAPHKIDREDDHDVTYCRRHPYVDASQDLNDCISVARG